MVAASEGPADECPVTFAGPSPRAATDDVRAPKPAPIWQPGHSSRCEDRLGPRPRVCAFLKGRTCHVAARSGRGGRMDVLAAVEEKLTV